MRAGHGQESVQMIRIEKDAYWSRKPAELLDRLASARNGLSESAAAERLLRDGPNTIADDSQASRWLLFARQFRSPLVLLLLVAATIAAGVGEFAEASIIGIIVLASTLLGFSQEYRASRSVAALRSRLVANCRVWRDGQPRSCPVREIVAGDVVDLSAGSLIPADGVLLQGRDCFVIQSVLTGESAPVEKLAAPSAQGAALAGRTNALFMGTSVRSGTAAMLVVTTGARTEFGQIAGRLKLQRPETDFERGIRRFSGMLTEFVLVLTVVVMGINLLLHRPPLESLLFAIALAVGITPELLPAIVSFTLSQGARSMAGQGVLVRRLSAIENLGSMTILCSDKTGTLTVGAARLAAALDAQGNQSPRVQELAAVNARLQTGLVNPLDEVILAQCPGIDPAYTKVDELPYDFVRKRMSVAVSKSGSQDALVITKGAPDSVLSVCSGMRTDRGDAALDESARTALLGSLEGHARQGYRVLAVASRVMRGPQVEESGMSFEGLLLFEDPAKPDIITTLRELGSLGVQLKIVTGDNQHTARHVAQTVGIDSPRLLTGEELDTLRDEALWQRARDTDVFAQVDPNQKERIILALRKGGAVVGYIGDGINDAPALHAADVGISVDGAVDVAREAADLVLLEHDLRVVNRGIEQGRATFANTQKYILAAVSANFGNMLSMAAASAFLPFLPLTAAQILLNNMLADFPALALAGDRVDPELVQRPVGWSIRHIRNFAVVFGGLSSLFDMLTFATLFWLCAGAVAMFRSGWFLESLATQTLVLLAIRTRRPLLTGSPGRALVVLVLLVLMGAMVLVETPVGRWFDLVPLPGTVLAAIALITLAYLAAVEILKRRYFWSVRG